MSPEKVVYMANQIATFFNTQPDADKAGKVAAHLMTFGIRACDGNCWITSPAAARGSIRW